MTGSIGSYSPFTGFVFIFNLIVGAGALTIPHAFANAGLIYGSIALSVLASVSYVTATFMIEAIAGVNALKRRAREIGLNDTNLDEKQPVDELSDSDDEAHTEFVPLMVSIEKQDALKRTVRTAKEELRFHFDLSKKVYHETIAVYMEKWMAQ